MRKFSMMDSPVRRTSNVKERSSNSMDLSPTSRRHSISSHDPRSRTLLHSASETRLPLRILARSLAPTAGPSTPRVPTMPPPAIDVKFIQMYVKKMGPTFRQNSDPTFNRRMRPLRSNDTTATNSEQSSSRTSSNDEIPPAKPGETGVKSIMVKSLRRSISGVDLKKEMAKLSESEREMKGDFVTCYRILESIFAGGSDAASNAALLCRLKIDHVVDLRANDQATGGKASKPPDRSIKSGAIDQAAIRCVCSDSRHRRSRRNFDISKSTSSGELIETFRRLNAFLTSARVRGEKTLLFDEDGRGSAPAAVAQYLMYYYHMDFSAAGAFVGEIISDIEIPEHLERAMISWESELSKNGDKESSSATYASHQLPEEQQEIPAQKKPAWT